MIRSQMYPSVAYQFFAMTPQVGPSGERRAGVAAQYTYKGMRGKSLTAPELTIASVDESDEQRALREAKQAHHVAWLHRRGYVDAAAAL